MSRNKSILKFDRHIKSLETGQISLSVHVYRFLLSEGVKKFLTSVCASNG